VSVISSYIFINERLADKQLSSKKKRATIENSNSSNNKKE